MRYTTESNVITGWVHGGDLENYMENYPRNCVVIYNQTPLPNDFRTVFFVQRG